MWEIVCTNCGRSYPETGVVHRCPTCGGVFDFKEFPTLKVNVGQSTHGIWDYLDWEATRDEYSDITLGEGHTPLIWDSIYSTSGKDTKVGFKCEYLNPTGSFKDRGSAAIISFLQKRGVTEIIEDSSGNAGASIAAYARRSGMNATIAVPAGASGIKKEQMIRYGATIKAVEGPRSKVTEVVLESLQGQQAHTFAYASHAYLPYNLPGYATIAVELMLQMGEVPGAVVAPVGQGGLLYGIYRGFEKLKQMHVIQEFPMMIGVQARACAPLWAVSNYGLSGYQWVSEGQTIAEGIRIKTPVRGDAVLHAVESSGGSFFVVDEEEIYEGWKELAGRGFWIEPTSAVVYPILCNHIDTMKQPVVAILTGSGVKSLGHYE